MNMDENSMDYIHLTNDKVLGNHRWKGKLDLLNIVMIGLTEALPERDEKYELHRLLSALLSSELPVKEKLNIIKTEYNIPLEDDARKEVDVMCNLSQGVLEKGEARGEAKIIINMSKKGYTLEQIADVTDKEVEEVKAIIEKHQPALV
jgi:hypothetical protein